MVELALFQPDIPHNTGALLRFCACLETTLHIIEPTGFRLDDKALKRSGMDYLDLAAMIRHNSWQDFKEKMSKEKRRILLTSTHAKQSFTQINYQNNDVILMGRESAGAPDYVWQEINHQITIPINKKARSLNLAISASMIMSEALRQTNNFPSL